MCMGMGQPILIPPSERGRAMADYLRTCLVLALLLALTEFMGAKYISGVLDILAAAIGYMAIRNPEGFNYQQVLCFLMIEFLFGLFAAIDLIMYAAGTRVDKVPTAQWQFLFYIAALMAGPILYSCITYFTYKLYKDMKAVVDDMVSGLSAAGGDGGGPMMGNGYDVQPPPAARQADAADSSGGGIWRHGESHPPPSISSSSSSSSGGFSAFSGTGHKLGDA